MNPPIINIFGDKIRGANLIGVAKSYIFLLMQQASFRKLKQLRYSKNIGGVVYDIWKNHNDCGANILVPIPSKLVKKPVSLKKVIEYIIETCNYQIKRTCHLYEQYPGYTPIINEIFRIIPCGTKYKEDGDKKYIFKN